MQRRHFLGTLTSGVIGATLARAQSDVSAPARTSLTRTPLVLMAPRPDGIEAAWGVNQLCKGRLEWETEDGSKGQAATDEFGFTPQGDKVLRVRVRDLKPGRTYKIRSVTVAAAGSAEEISPWRSFRTLDPSAARTEFVVWNDTHINNPTIKKLHEVTPSADFLLWNGDMCNDWKSPDLLVPTLLHPGECDITGGRPLFVTWGNHDVRGPHAFSMPDVVATPNGRPFYAFRSGPVAVICLHTGEDKPDSHPSFQGRVAFDSLRREQTEWLADTTRRPEFRSAPYRIVFCHIPLRWREERLPDYSTGGFDFFSHRSRQAWNSALTDWKAQLVISGHTHNDAWLPPSDEFPYGQLVGGGPQLRSATWMHAQADEKQLTIKVNDLAGKVRHEVSVKPIA